MIASYVREAGSTRAEAGSGRMQDAVPFLATCPKCKHQRVQHGYDRATLLTLFNRGCPVRAYCLECEDSWAINNHEEDRLASWLFM
jgi:hypothetical protein